MVGGRGRTHEEYAVTFIIVFVKLCQCDVTACCGTFLWFC